MARNHGIPIEGRERHLTEDDIRTRAYDLYEARGRTDGNAVDDWLRAEQELTRSTASPTDELPTAAPRPKARAARTTAAA